MGRGSIRERGKGRWQIRVYVGQDLEGRRRYASETFRGSERDAQRRMRRLLDEVDNGAHRGPDHTVGELLDAWLEARGPSLSPSTLAMTQVHVRRYLEPRLGRVRLSKLDAAALDTFYGTLKRQGVKGKPLSDSYVRRIHGTLHLALEQAVAWDWLVRNPASRATPPPARRGELAPPSAEEVRLILDEALRTNAALATYLLLAAAAGPRRGELAGLRRSDVDFDEVAVTFRRAIVFGGEGELVVKPYPKTRVARRVAIDAGTMQALRDHLRRQAEGALMLGQGLDRNPWVFSFSPRCDTPPRPDAFTRAFIRLRDRLGLSVRLHDLRHAHATSLLTAGVDIRTVAGRLGHASPSTTLTVYAGWVPAADRAAADIAGELLAER